MSNILPTKQGKIVLKFKRLTVHAIKPIKASELSAGYDLFSAYDNNVTSKGSALIKTDLQIQVPNGCYGRVAPRSGLALKHSIDVGAGVIDADYRGNLGVILFNFGDSDFQVRKGDRIAQLICEKIEYPELEEVDEGKILELTSRGVNGFGSSGLQ